MSTWCWATDLVRSARPQQVDELRHLDDGRDADDGDAERLADGELDAVDIGQVDVEEQLLVALRAEQADGGIADGRHLRGVYASFGSALGRRGCGTVLDSEVCLGHYGIGGW